MFTCGICMKVSKPWDKAMRVVVETREKVYPFRKGVQHFVDKSGIPQVRDDPGGTGREIVREVLAHELCAMSVSNEGGIIGGSK